MTTMLAAEDIESARRYHRQREARRRGQREAERQCWLQRVREAVARLAPQHAEVQRVVLFGSLVQPGRFGPDSDIDVGVECDTAEAEVAFWRALERELGRAVLDRHPLEADTDEDTLIVIAYYLHNLYNAFENIFWNSSSASCRA